MRFVAENSHSRVVKEKVEAAYHSIRDNFRWSHTADRCLQILSRCSAPVINDRPVRRLAVVTSWNTRCGIAEYSRYLLEALIRKKHDLQPVVLCSPTEEIWPQHVIPSQVCWRNRYDGNMEELRHQLIASEFDAVHFQFNFGFFDLHDLGKTLEELARAGKKVILTLHCTADLPENGRIISLGQIAEPLRRANAILVHSRTDQERLESWGIKDNVYLFPHGNVLYPLEDKALRKMFGVSFDPAVGTFGFLLPHKGMLELLAAVKQLRPEYPNLGLLAQCALHQDQISSRFERVVRKRIEELGLSSCVLLSTKFLEPDEANLFLQLSDLLVLPYKGTPESTSASVRFALAAGRPVITTNREIFQDVAAVTYQIPSSDPKEIAAAIRDVLRDQAMAEKLTRQSQHYTEGANWDRIAELYIELVRSL